MIRLKSTYRGKPSGEQPIAPGDYADDDARLFGLADYLVTNGHAVRLPAPQSLGATITEHVWALPENATFSDTGAETTAINIEPEAKPKGKRK